MLDTFTVKIFFFYFNLSCITNLLFIYNNVFSQRDNYFAISCNIEIAAGKLKSLDNIRFLPEFPLLKWGSSNMIVHLLSSQIMQLLFDVRLSTDLEEFGNRGTFLTKSNCNSDIISLYMCKYR